MVPPIADLSLLPPEQRMLVEGELREGEELLWMGQPDAKRLARRMWPILIFAVPWTGFALFWIWKAAGSKMPSFSGGSGMAWLFGVPFVLVGLGMLSTPWWTRRSAARTVYVITDRRAITIDGTRSRRIRSVDSTAFGNIDRHERPDGGGDIIFDRRQHTTRGGSTEVRVIAFRSIANVKEVETLLRDIAAINVETPPPAS